MLKVLLTDDEYSQRGYLRNIIDWSSEGFEIVGEAGNGLEALTAMEKLKPDLMFLDINMPEMDGLQLLKKINEMDKQIRVVIISGFDAFEYAREAMEYGVKNYLLKPVNEVELLKIIKKIKYDIGMEKNNRFELSKLYEKLSQSMPLLREKFLLELISGRFNFDKLLICEKTDFLDIKLSGNEFIVAIIEIDDTNNSLKSEKNRQILKLAIQEVGCDVLNSLGNFVFFNDGADKVSVIIGLEDNRERSQEIPIFEEIIKNVNSDLGIKITIGLGGKYSLENIFKSYNEALSALRAKIYLGNNKVIDCLDFETLEEKYVCLPEKYREQLSLYIKQCESNMAFKLIDDILSSYKDKRLPFDYIKILSIEIVTIGITQLALMGYSVSHVFTDGYNPMDEIGRHNSLEGLKKYLEDFYKKIIDFKISLHSPGLSQIVLKAQNYIDGNYTDSKLSLENIAAHLYIHPVYLSSTFKKETKKTITEYIIGIRMKKALDIINSASSYLLSEIAIGVGYEDPYYFSKTFKKHFGFSPSEITKKAYY